MGNALAHEQAQLIAMQLHSLDFSDKGGEIKGLFTCWMLLNLIISLGVRVLYYKWMMLWIL